jgi:hypothetical protein
MLSMRCCLVLLTRWYPDGLVLGGIAATSFTLQVHPTSSSLETARNNERPGSMVGLERVVTERCWTQSAGLRDRRQAFDERGRGGQ